MDDKAPRLLSAEEQRVVELVKEYQNGNKEAFDKIYSLLYSSMYYFIYKMIRDEYLAEDILQEVFLLAYRKIPTIEKPQAFKKWLNLTAYHCCVDFVRSSKGRTDATEDISEHESLPMEPDINTDACLRILEKEKHDTVMEAVETLSEPLKNTVKLKFFGGLKEREIANVMEVPVGTVKSRLSAAKKELSVQLKGVYSIAPFFFLHIGVAKHAGEAGIASGVHMQARAARRVAAVTAGVTVGTAALVITKGPVISDLKMFEPEKYVNCQTIEWTADSMFPIAKAEVADTLIPVNIENGVYSAEIRENGIYMVRVTDVNGRSAEKPVKIENIDSVCPEYLSYEENNGGMILKFSDAVSGIDWDQLAFTDRNGRRVEPKGTDELAGTALIDKKDFPLEAHVEDEAGNYGNYRIDLNTVTLAEKKNRTGGNVQ
jgi:RNA polymerase sigma-70 factor (ECF subfamily)